MSELRIIISGGGTGGHIYPALTIADAIKKERPDAKILFIGTEHGLEKDLVPRAGYEIRFIEVQGFKRSLSLDTAKSVYHLFTGLHAAGKILDEFKPDLVIGTGGYVCGPVVFLAARRGIPSCIQEQNAMPGVTNKILSRFVDRIFMGYNEAGRYFSDRAEKIFTGNPIRPEIMQAKKEDGLRAFGLDPARRTVLIAGGSLGAASLNRAALKVEESLAGRDDVQVLHATGAKNFDAYMEQAGKNAADNIHIEPYIYDMPQALATADLAVFRSGAIGLAELTARGVPSILVPYPYATANHQEFNARALEAKGAAEVVLDKDLDSEVLHEKIERLLMERESLKKMHEAALAASRPKAAEQIALKALELVKKSKKTKR